MCCACQVPPCVFPSGAIKLEEGRPRKDRVFERSRRPSLSPPIPSLSSLEVATTKKNTFDAVIHEQESPRRKQQLLVGCRSLNTSRFASRLLQAVSAWSGKPRRAPSQLCSDAAVYGHATTVMRDISTPPALSPPPRPPSPSSTIPSLPGTWSFVQLHPEG